MSVARKLNLMCCPFLRHVRQLLLQQSQTQAANARADIKNTTNILMYTPIYIYMCAFVCIYVSGWAEFSFGLQVISFG